MLYNADFSTDFSVSLGSFVHYLANYDFRQIRAIRDELVKCSVLLGISYVLIISYMITALGSGRSFFFL